MAKVFDGVVVSLKMHNTAVVEVVRRFPHPLYGKLLKRSKKYKVDLAGKAVMIGDKVRIIETRPISKDKHFAIQSIIESAVKKSQTKQTVSEKKEEVKK